MVAGGSAQEMEEGERIKSGTTRGWLAGYSSQVRDFLERYSKRTSRQHKRLVFFVLLVGAALRAWMLFAPIVEVEAFVFLRYATLPVGELVADYSHPENHVFHTLLVKLFTTLLGVDLQVLRLPSFLAGVLLMPLFYLVTRALFNRYIALMALALVAGSAPLIELGSLATGHALGLFCMVLALVFARHVAQTNDRTSAALLALALALGTWSVVSLVHAALMVFLWLLFFIGTRYRRSYQHRLITVLWSGLLYLGLLALFYLPIIAKYGVGQLILHTDLPRYDWTTFIQEYPEGAHDLWLWLVHGSAGWFAMAGLAALVFAAYVSGRYRMFLVALLGATVPLVLLRARVAPPADWAFAVPIFHLGMAIALFYLLKFIQERLAKGFGKRGRTAWTAMLLLLVTGAASVLTVPGHLPRFPEAAWSASYLDRAISPGDRVYVDPPWSDPLHFHALEQDMDGSVFTSGPAPGAMGFVVVGALPTQTVQGVLEHGEGSLYDFDSWEMVKDWERMEIFAARLRTDLPVDAAPEEER